MPKRGDEHKRSVPKPGMVSDGGVDAGTGAATGALAGAVLGASGGPAGLLAGALIGGAIGRIAAHGREHPDYPEHWLAERERLHEHNIREQKREEP